MPRALKVYRTPIGFHDAYVAAPSQKAALTAWGADADLFARGLAEIVTDEALTREPLASPGTVVRRPRGTAAEHLAALPDASPPAKRTRSPAPDGPAPSCRMARGRSSARPAPPPRPAPPKPASPPKPPPSRRALEAAEQALFDAQAEHEAALDALRREERALQARRRALEGEGERRRAELERAAADERDRYEAALRRWRE